MISAELFERLFPSKGLNPRKYNLVAKRAELIAALNKFLPAYEINDRKRVSAFLSCCGVETDYFKTTEEYATGADYEGRKDLGNTQKGDGRRYKGRGVIQTTGRYNYELLQKVIGVLGFDVVKDPGLLNLVDVAVESACVYWKVNSLNVYADAKEIKQLNGKVNRGSPNKVPLHWAKRNELYSKCWRLIPSDLSFADPAAPIAEVNPIDITPEMETRLSSAQATLQSPSIKTVGRKVGWKVGSSLAGVWSTTGGKIALILTAIVVIGGLGYLGYLYRSQIQLGWQIAVATVKKKVGLS